jgi:hypothetical protein
MSATRPATGKLHHQAMPPVWNPYTEAITVWQCCDGAYGMIRSQLIATELKLAHVWSLAHMSSTGLGFFVGAALIR